MSFDSVLENFRKIKVILSEKLHTFDLANNNIIKAQSKCQWGYIDIVDVGHIIVLNVLKCCNSQLDDAKVESCFFDAFVELEMIGEQALNAMELGDEAGKLAVEGDEV